jgi:hypothetical protein
LTARVESSASAVDDPARLGAGTGWGDSEADAVGEEVVVGADVNDSGGGFEEALFAVPLAQAPIANNKVTMRAVGAILCPDRRCRTRLRRVIGDPVPATNIPPFEPGVGPQTTRL